VLGRFECFGGSDGRFRAIDGAALTFQASDASGGSILNFERLNTIAANRQHIILASVDLSDTAKRHVYIWNDVEQIVRDYSDLTWSTYVDTAIPFGGLTNVRIGASNAAGNYFDGRQGPFFFDTVYTDLSDEATRLRFFDKLGFFADWGSTASEPTGSQPLVALRWDPAQGIFANDGSGGDFAQDAGSITHYNPWRF